uniref:Uncharacterized protein n=1 Tax=Timema cristinae TaxID=61476 RepID=A0A7R9CJB5_TIMCR|nr:unnamed protein product [Timema cristinae]
MVDTGIELGTLYLTFQYSTTEPIQEYNVIQGASRLYARQPVETSHAYLISFLHLLLSPIFQIRLQFDPPSGITSNNALGLRRGPILATCIANLIRSPSPIPFARYRLCIPVHCDIDTYTTIPPMRGDKISRELVFCRYAISILGRYAITRLGRYAITRLGRYAITRLGEVCNNRAGEVCGNKAWEVCGNKAWEVCNIMAREICDIKAGEVCNIKAGEVCNIKAGEVCDSKAWEPHGPRLYSRNSLDCQEPGDRDSTPARVSGRAVILGVRNN